MSSRRTSRHRAVQVLYQCDMRSLAADEAIAAFYGGLYSEENEEKPEQDPFMESLVRGAVREEGARSTSALQSTRNDGVSSGCRR